MQVRLHLGIIIGSAPSVCKSTFHPSNDLLALSLSLATLILRGQHAVYLSWKETPHQMVAGQRWTMNFFYVPRYGDSWKGYVLIIFKHYNCIHVVFSAILHFLRGKMHSIIHVQQYYYTGACIRASHEPRRKVQWTRCKHDTVITIHCMLYYICVWTACMYNI